MKQTSAIHAALKRLLKARGRTYADAAGVLELSEASIKRLFASSELSLERIERLCDWLGVDIAEVVALAQSEQPALTELTPAQERELLADPSLTFVAFLVLNHWTEAEILATFAFTKPELTLRLIRLERLGLLELMPFERIKLRTARNFAWRRDGPVRRFVAEKVLPEFFASRFDAAGEHMQFVGGMLSRASMHKLQEGIDALARQLDELVAQDLALPIAERHGITLFAGVRPWEYSGFSKLRRGPKPDFE
jgi:transcriptional regulator with XRE-family HTH domain